MTFTALQYEPSVGVSEKDEASEPVSIVQHLSARFRETAQEVSLSYDEPDENSRPSARVQLYFTKSDPNTITLTRSGAQNYVLVFCEGRRHASEYLLPEMNIELSVVTRRLHNALLSEGSLHLEYSVELQGCSDGLRVIDIRLDDPSEVTALREYRT
ncbi:MAG: DUF1934 domain-containing protein [Clostridia bacterium]|nr:DUF1934 domain-containing protein [Clostridia bacterium]